MEIQDDMNRKQLLKEKTKKSQQQFETYKHKNKYDHEDSLHHNY